MRELSYNKGFYRLSKIAVIFAVIAVVLTSAYNISAASRVYLNIGSEKISGNNNDISESNKNINGNFNIIRGDGNTINGNNNDIYGDDNIISGNFNKIYGENNIIRGNNNKFTPDAGNTVSGNFNREHD